MRLTLCPLILALVSAPALSAEDDITFGGRVSTLGLGVETATAFPTPWINLRAQAHFGAFDRDFDGSGVPFDGEVELLNAAVLADFFLIDQFRLSLGAVINKNRIKLDRTGAGTLIIGSTRYRAEADFSLSGETEFPSVAPYVAHLADPQGVAGVRFGGYGGPETVAARA
jgi:hypothetical protein